MKHEDKIKKMTIHVEFECFGRIGWIEADITMEALTNPLALRARIDDHIGSFLRGNDPLRIKKFM